MTDQGPPTDEASIANWFSYHPPQGQEDIDAYQAIRSAGRQLAEMIVALTPPSRERSLALTKVRESVMWANAARACNQPDDTEAYGSQVSVAAGTYAHHAGAAQIAPAPTDVATVGQPEGLVHAAARPGALCGLVSSDMLYADERAGVTCQDCITAIKRMGYCTTCSRPAWPHNMRHPITTVGKRGE